MIWIIDDDAYMLKLLGYKIQKLGHDVALFHSAEEAISAASGRELSHVFTDIHLSGKSGFELAAALREQHKLSETVFVALTAADLSQDDRAEMLFDYVFRKPLDDEELESVFSSKLEFPYLNAMIESEEDKTEIIRHFHEETCRDSEELRNALDGDDTATMILLAHRLSGRLAQFSQEKISAGFRSVEQMLINDKKEIRPDLESALRSLTIFLKKLENI